jgi:hypothetical protein
LKRKTRSDQDRYDSTYAGFTVYGVRRIISIRRKTAFSEVLQFWNGPNTNSSVKALRDKRICTKIFIIKIIEIPSSELENEDIEN